MKILIRPFSTIYLWAMMSGSVLAGDVISDANEHYVTTDRYTQTSIQPRNDQLMPLDALVNFAFGDEVKTVGAAIIEMLEGSGYRWIPPTTTSDALLHELALPVVNRDIGPVRLRDALSTVAGPAWQLRIDDLHRTIWFETTTSEEKSKKSFWRRNDTKPSNGSTNKLK